MTKEFGCWWCLTPDGTCTYPKSNKEPVCPVCGSSKEQEEKPQEDCDGGN